MNQFFRSFWDIAKDRLFCLPTHRRDVHRNFLMIPSLNRNKISVKGDTSVLLGVKELKPIAFGYIETSSPLLVGVEDDSRLI